MHKYKRWFRKINYHMHLIIIAKKCLTETLDKVL